MFHFTIRKKFVSTMQECPRKHYKERAQIICIGCHFMASSTSTNSRSSTPDTHIIVSDAPKRRWLACGLPEVVCFLSWKIANDVLRLSPRKFELAPQIIFDFLSLRPRKVAFPDLLTSDGSHQKAWQTFVSDRVGGGVKCMRVESPHSLALRKAVDCST